MDKTADNVYFSDTYMYILRMSSDTKDIRQREQNRQGNTTERIYDITYLTSYITVNTYKRKVDILKKNSYGNRNVVNELVGSNISAGGSFSEP